MHNGSTGAAVDRGLAWYCNGGWLLRRSILAAAVAVRALAGTPHTVPAQSLGYDLSRIPILPHSDVCRAHERVGARQVRAGRRSSRGTVDAVGEG
jgi:hypothetical protein